MHEMHEEWEIERSYQVIRSKNRPKITWSEGLEREKKYPMMLSFLHYTFARLKHTDVIFWLADNCGEIVIYAFLLGFSDRKSVV